MEKATFAGGCFWCTEAVFQRLRGVHSVKPGYTGGTVKDPTFFDHLYAYAWFITFALSFVLYLLLMRGRATQDR